MSPGVKNTLAAILGVAGTLLILAMAFGILPGNYALFGGIACFVVAGAVKTQF
jgi:hypothetical protein